MKFGDTLSLRSVPQWQNHNIDYASIKQVIKENTTPGKGRAVAIPGKSELVSAAFEQQLFDLFAKEHDRLSLFVKSKTYEINSRLGSIDRQLSAVRQRRNLNRTSRHGTLRTRKRLLAVETETFKVGQEIQNLSRFIAINRQAIRKLVKKYQKWTKSTTFGPMVESRLILRPDSFAEVKMKPLLLQYTAYLDALRSPFEQDDLDPAEQGLPSNGDDKALERSASGASSNSQEAEYGPFGVVSSGVEFDAALKHDSSDLHINEAVYWVHEDNAVELRILLLQYLRYAKISSLRRSSTAITNEGKEAQEPKKEDTFGNLILESDQSSSTSKHRKANKPSITALWSNNEDAIICIANQQSDAKTGPKRIRRAKNSLGSLTEFLNSKIPLASDASVYGPSESTEMDLANSFHEDLEDLVPVRCVAEIVSRRSRFIGLENSNNESEHIWAALDEDMTMHPVTDDSFKSQNFAESTHQDGKSVRFPHAVLTVRAEGRIDGFSSLISVLDQSHLTERVYGYSSEAHAMILFSAESSKFEKPEWFSQLDKDIRHIPSQSTDKANSNSSSRSPSYLSIGHFRRSSGSGNEASESTPITVDSGQGDSATDNMAASGSEARNAMIGEKHMNKKINQRRRKDDENLNHDIGGDSRGAQLERRAAEKPMGKQAEQLRYWNEYDNPPSSVGRDFVAGEDEEEMIVLPREDGSQDSNESSTSGNWFTKLLGLQHALWHEYTTHDVETASITSSEDENDVTATDKTPLFGQQSHNAASYDTFPRMLEQRRRVQSVFISFWFLLLSAGVSLEAACAITISNSGLSRIDDESTDDGVYMALIIMGIMTGCLLIGMGIYGLLRVWRLMRTREKAMAEKRRLGKQKQRRFS